MTTTEAKEIIQSLADGRYPITGEPFPPESPLQQPVIVRALAVALRALERVERIERRAGSLPEHAGRAWDAEEDDQLCSEFDEGKTVAELAAIHQRTRGAIQARLARLGKLTTRRTQE